ncbi:MAG: glycosyltransferase [Simkaniaceae bacterium]|nr:glycosyltransferase [Candidatus Sacchlamyda saccharinae]
MSFFQAFFPKCNANEENDFAIAIIGYNRPDYLEEVLESLAANPESSTTPIYFFFDGGPESKQKENIALARKYAFPLAKIISRTTNFGCPKNIIDARRVLFDKLKYKKVLVIEDDNVISSNYIRFILNFYEWSQLNMSGVGAVCGWNQLLLNKYEKNENLQNVIQNSMWNYWGYLMSFECWEKIKGIYYEYEALFLGDGGRSHYINAEKIRSWLRRRVLTHANYGDPYSESFLIPGLPTGQDAVMRIGLWENDLDCACSYVNRLINIGKVGINYSEEVWEKRLKDFVLDVFPEDNDLIEFRVVSDPTRPTTFH